MKPPQSRFYTAPPELYVELRSVLSRLPTGQPFSLTIHTDGNGNWSAKPDFRIPLVLTSSYCGMTYDNWGSLRAG
jgi:hypothetical protein